MASCGMSQIRFYKDNHKDNVPFPTHESYAKAFSFQTYNPIRKFTVYTLPGTMLYIDDISNPFVVGQTGVLEFDFTNREDPLSKFRVDERSMEIINNNPGGHLIVNLIHDDGGDNTKEEV